MVFGTNIHDQVRHFGSEIQERGNQVWREILQGKGGRMIQDTVWHEMKKERAGKSNLFKNVNDVVMVPLLLILNRFHQFF